MSNDRRFSDEQVRLILARAASASVEQDGPGVTDGQTLTELVRIGAEAGIPEHAIRQAAAMLEANATDAVATERRTFGIGTRLVARIPTGRPINDRAWKRVVARLRVVREAKGTVKERDGIREWRHRDVRVVVESTPTGDVVHMTATQDAAGLFGGIATAITVFGLIFLLAFLQLAPTERERGLWVLGALIGTIGGTMLVAQLISMRRWARERTQLLRDLRRDLPSLLGDDGR